MDIYKIPQPVPVDITYNIKIFCTKMRHLNEFNKLVLQKFSSRQSYTFVKGHYVPLILNNVSDESVLDIEKRKYYIQNYEFLMMGFLIDENEFEVLPAITRSFSLFEFSQNNVKRKLNKFPENYDNFELDVKFINGLDSLSERFNYNVDLSLLQSENIDTYSIFINDSYIGDNVTSLMVNSGDLVKIDIVKTSPTKDSTLKFLSKLV
jgi:hypothetical protein